VTLYPEKTGKQKWSTEKNRKVDRGLYGLNCIWGPYSAQMVNSSTNEFVIIFQLKPFYDIKKKIHVLVRWHLSKTCIIFSSKNNVTCMFFLFKYYGDKQTISLIVVAFCYTMFFLFCFQDVPKWVTQFYD